MNNWVLNEGERLDDLVRGDMKMTSIQEIIHERNVAAARRSPIKCFVSG